MNVTRVDEKPLRAQIFTVIRGRFRDFREGGILALFSVLMIAIRLVAPRFWSLSNIKIILLSVALLLVVAVGQLVVMIGRNFDLTTGSVVGLSAMIVGTLFKDYPGMSIGLAFLAAIVVGILVGIINGTAIVYLRVPSVVFTLGMLSVISGFTYVVSNGGQINPFNVPQKFVALSLSSSFHGIPVLLIIAIILACVIGGILRWTRSGRSLYAYGSNPEAAKLRGLRVDWLVIGSFVVSGAVAGLGGAIYLSQYGLVQNSAGAGLELQAITIVIVGGASIFGGAGTVLGTGTSCLLLVAMANGIAVLGYSTFWQDAMYGALLVLAVASNSVSRRIQASRALIRPELKL